MAHTELNELELSLSKRLDGEYGFNGTAVNPAIDLVQVRTWDEPDMSSADNGVFQALTPEDLWLVIQIKRARTKKQIIELALGLAGRES